MADNSTLVLFGARGNLSRIKLIPGLFHLDEVGKLSDAMKIVSVGRQNISQDEWENEIKDMLEKKFEGKYNLYPSLSYDGKLLLYLTQDQGKFKVALQNLQTNQVLKLTKGPLDEAPVFAPNGHMVLFVYKNYGKTTKIGTVSINGLKIDPLPLGSRQVQEPAWGPIKN